MPRLLTASLSRERNALARGVLTLPQIGALHHLDAAGALRMNALAARLGSPAPTVTAMADRLVSLGLVTRAPDPADRRSVQLKLTTKGGGILRRLRNEKIESIKRMFGTLTDRERAVLLRGMEKAVETFGERGGTPS